MAIQEQVELLQQGADAWNMWRSQHREVPIDLSGANLNSVSLINADMSTANLSNTDLRSAILLGVNFSHANLRRTILDRALIWGANLRDANLSGAILSHTDFSDANLSDANLNGAIFRRAILSCADFRGTQLGSSDLSSADLNGIDLSGAFVVSTHFADVDLRMVQGLETIHHTGPSYISTSTLERSHGDIPEAFLRGAGLSDTFIEYVRSLVARPIGYYTCFLSYSHKDQDIAERLYADLQSKGVRCWYAPHELKPGDYYRDKIDESIRIYDKLVLILSEHSIKSEWVEKEVKTALEREESMDMTRHVLFPIRLDNAAMTTSRKWVSSLRYLRQIGDFTGWRNHETYQTAFQRLLRDLKAEPVKKNEVDSAL